jgi:hypothetical protein
VLAVNFKSPVTPAALDAITSGERSTLSETEMVPETLPAAFGLNAAVTVALLPALNVRGSEIPETLIPAPDGTTLVKVTLALLAFANFMVCELVLPSVTLPNVTAAGVATIACPCGCGVPVGGPEALELDTTPAQPAFQVIAKIHAANQAWRTRMATPLQKLTLPTIQNPPHTLKSLREF